MPPPPATAQPGWYGTHVLPHLLDFACGLSMITKQRQLVPARWPTTTGAKPPWCEAFGTEPGRT